MKRKILAAISFKEPVEDIYKKISDFIGPGEVELYLIHVIEDLPYISFYANAYPLWNEFKEQAVETAEGTMKEYREKFSQHFSTMETFIEVGDVPEKILGKGKDLDIDLIVVGTHGRKGIDRFVHSNVAEKVIRRAKRPVLCYFIDTNKK